MLWSSPAQHICVEGLKGVPSQLISLAGLAEDPEEGRRDGGLRKGRNRMSCPVAREQ